MKNPREMNYKCEHTLMADFYSNNGFVICILTRLAKKKKKKSFSASSTFDLQVIIVERDTSILVELGAVFSSIPPVGFSCDLEAPRAPL